MVSSMGKPGRSYQRGLVCTLVIAMVLAGSILLAAPSEAAPGDLLAPVYADGDWWNSTWDGPVAVHAKVGEYEIEFTEVQGWLRMEVDGTTSHLGKVSWIMKVSGHVRLSGDWSSGTETGTTHMDANVSGKEWRASNDLGLLGSAVSYSGQVEIATLSGPEYFSLTVWENRTLDKPMRMMLFPVPIATFPDEDHNVEMKVVFESGSYGKTRVEKWQYETTYKGLADVQGGSQTYTNQHRFQVIGNMTIGEEKTPIDLSLYYENTPRKATTVDQVRNLEVNNYEVSQAINHPDLVVADGEFNVTDYTPTDVTEVNFTATVHNLGAREVLDIKVELWASMDEDMPSRQNSTTILNIGPNENAIIHFNWTPLGIGDWEFFLRVDPTNTVTEAREDNNEATLTLVVSPDVPKPNLYVVDNGISMDPPSPVHNRTAVQITIIVGNDGPGDAYNVTADLYLGEPGSGGVAIAWRETIDQIPSGENGTAVINWAADVPGPLTIWVYLDSNNTVEETVETDNLASIPLHVIESPAGEVDLVVAAVGIIDPNGVGGPYPSGERLTLTATIENTEAKDAPRVHMSVYIDTEDPQGLVGAYEGPIDGKGLVTWEVTWVVDRENGAHEVIVTVVALGEVEATYIDNVRTTDFVIGPRTIPDPEPLDVTIFPDSTVVSPNQHIQVSGKVTLVKNGFEVPGALVTIKFRGQPNEVQVVTNDLGRYLANITVPNRDGNYRLEVIVNEGFSEGNSALTITVQSDTTTNNGGGDDGILDLSFFIISLVVLLAVLMPLTYYILVSRAEIRRRVRHVHEEIVEIVDEDKK
jgi:hypothetical protein